jgi:hypothetical protein
MMIYNSDGRIHLTDGRTREQENEARDGLGRNLQGEWKRRAQNFYSKRLQLIEKAQFQKINASKR